MDAAISQSVTKLLEYGVAGLIVFVLLLVIYVERREKNEYIKNLLGDRDRVLDALNRNTIALLAVKEGQEDNEAATREFTQTFKTGVGEAITVALAKRVGL